jgi:hypothetical protein
MEAQLSAEDLDVILTALSHAKHQAENHAFYPSYEFKQAQLARIENATQKVRALRDNKKEGTV